MVIKEKVKLTLKNNFVDNDFVFNDSPIIFGDLFNNVRLSRIEKKIPKNVKITVEKSTIIKISGIDKDLVGKVASEIKMLKPVEPYKAKGIKERGQYVIRKEGKKK